MKKNKTKRKKWKKKENKKEQKGKKKRKIKNCKWAGPASTPAALGNLGGTAAPRLPPHYVNAEEK